MIIAGYLKTSLIEWPGKIASVIFTQGCNFRCPFCHNADLVGSRFPQISNRFTQIDQEEVFSDLKKRKKWIDAVVITGGEPTLQEDLPEFLSKLRDLGFLRMVETNGSRPEVVGKLIEGGLVDYWTMDLKGDLDNYPQFAGMQKSKFKNQNYNLKLKIKECIGLIIGSGVVYEFRTTVVPGMHNLENLKQLAGEIRQICQIGQIGRTEKAKKYELKWFLQQFRPVNCLDKSFLKKKPFTKEEMEGFLVEVKKVIPNTNLRGV